MQPSEGQVAVPGKDDPKSSRAPYIRPQQGLRLRKSGGVLQVNLENIGGRILVLAERNTHKNRMRSIKPVVNVKPPWGHDDPKGSRGRQAATLRTPTSTPAAAGGSGSRPGTAGSVKRQLRIGDAARPLERAADLSSLTEEDSKVAQDFIQLLGRLTPGQAKALADHAVNESEERRLLEGYCGVFPELSDSDDGSSDGEEASAAEASAVGAGGPGGQPAALSGDEGGQVRSPTTPGSTDSDGY